MLDRYFILHLSLIDGIGPATIRFLLDNKRIDTRTTNLYLFSASDWMHAYGVTQACAQKIVTGLADKILLESELSLIDKHRINWVTLLDDDYPSLLREIHVPPAVLYYRGNLYNSDDKHLAIVGSRAATSYGVKAVTGFIPELVAANITIVSGGALGVDTIAHDVTVKHGGRTIAVLGSGLLQEYPAVNKKLFASIIQTGGAIVSSFSLRTKPLPGNFPARNRIIAGLSHACLVAQAAQKSGALITAHYALEQGRDVYAIPGNIDDPLSVGCNALIQQGAKLVTSGKDIIEELGCEYIPAVQFIPNDSSTTSVFADMPTLSLLQKNIVSACAENATLDDILEKTGYDMSVVQSELFSLQLEGIIQQDFTGRWTVIR